ncbi:hypothetical protein ACOI1H_17260 [Loktanella sp. DJP18]|uniref:hypothetical protein n=1 Tax=Loktanella sp. DJP18 TaxID=3409788 RepID=UPI003BB523B2
MTAAPHIVLHLGAHKTATTHLQHSLIAQRIPLWEAGIRTLMPPHLRGKGRSLEARFDLPINRKVSGTGPAPEEVRARLIGTASRLVVSEENFLGVLQTRKGRVRLPLYPRARQRLGMLIPVLAPGQGVDLCFALRDPAGFLNSAYGQVLMGGQRISPDDFKAANPLGAVDWGDIVMRLRATPGINRLTVWRHEDYAALFGDICTVLLGDCAVPVRPVPEVVHGGLSRDAVHATLTGTHDAPTARAAFPVGPDNPPFNAFTDEELDLSREFYAVQMKEIAAVPGIDLLRP